MGVQEAITSVPVVGLLMVKYNVTIESQALAAPPMMLKIAVLFEVVYVFPSIHIYDSHATWVSVPKTVLLMVRSNVAIESQPLAAPPMMLNVAVLFEVVYVFPSIQVKGVQEASTSVPFTELPIVKSKVTKESQPLVAPSRMLKVAVLFEVV